ncbi:MAG: type I DNA topoisomerase [Sphaerochaetaceae bacterium]
MPEKKSALIIVESPTKARTISRFLPSDCTVLASYGHIRALPEDSLSIDVAHGYKPRFEIIEGKQKIIAQIKSALSKADELILATDEDREGESISWHLVEVLKPKVPYRRMVFHEITKSAILEAFEKGRDIDMALVRAQEARRILDRLYGYSLSPILWKKLSNKTYSAGRVQSPGLRLVVDRERARLSFKPGSFWDLKAGLDTGSGTFEARLVQVGAKKVADGKSFDSETGEYIAKKNVILLSEEDSAALVERLKGAEWKVRDVSERTASQRPAPPFVTSTLQQEGNRKLHLSAKDTMRVAQTLYERGFITYMRTDSPALSHEGTQAARDAVTEVFGQEFLSPQARRFSARSANAQEAHEAIRPAAQGGRFISPSDTGLSGRELALYSLIFKRTLACQMAEAVKTTTTAMAEADDCVFESSGTRIDFPGFIRAYVESTDEEGAEDGAAVLPALRSGMSLELVSLQGVSHETKMPVRFTEASLVQTLEKMGIGRPSTYATIIDRIMEKKYVRKESNALVPTFSGFGVIQLLESNFPNLIEYDFTKDMEGELDRISKGEVDEIGYLKKFYEGESGLKKQCEGAAKTIDSKKAKQIILPQISAGNQILIGPYGAYVTNGDEIISIPSDRVPASVSNDYIESLKNSDSSKESVPDVIVGTDPETGEPIYQLSGRFGDYWQIGKSNGAGKPGAGKPRRFSIPKDFQGKKVPEETILKFFSLPKVLGKDPAGRDVSIGAGKYGPYVVRDGDFRSVPSFEVLFGLSLDTALQILSSPKPERRAGASRAKGASGSGSAAASAVSKVEIKPVVDFGEHEGQRLAIVYGRYGYYLKHGAENHKLPPRLRNDEAACRAMSRDEALACLKDKSN